MAKLPTRWDGDGSTTFTQTGTGDLLLEDGTSYLLLEDGTTKLSLEAATVTVKEQTAWDNL